MDLEVIVPIDLGSGDHQHLVRKAVDNDVPPSGRPPTPSPAERSKETGGKPKPKADKKSNVYVIEISDDPPPDENNGSTPGPFSDRSIRHGEKKETT